MIEFKIRNGSKKKEVQVLFSKEGIKELENRIKILEFDIKKLELDIEKIGDRETRKFAERRLRELREELEALKKVRAIGGVDTG